LGEREDGAKNFGLKATGGDLEGIRG
jgi:hypothetical protein